MNAKPAANHGFTFLLRSFSNRLLLGLNDGGNNPLATATERFKGSVVHSGSLRL